MAGGLPLLLQDRVASYIYGPGGQILEQIAGSTATYYHADQLGSVRALTSQTGAVVATYAYDAYGQPTASTGSVANPFRYAGEYQDAESGLYYLRARYYDPTTQQFLTVDPLLAATEQAYAYAGGSPLNATDPSGLHCGQLNDDDEGGCASDYGLGGEGWIPPWAAGAGATTGDRPLYRSGNTTRPSLPRIEGANYTGNKPDLQVDIEGNVRVGQGGISCFEQVDQLPTKGKVWRLPARSATPGFQDNPDGQPLGPHAAGHHSLVPIESLTPEELIGRFLKWGWEPVPGPNGNQLEIR